MGQYTKSYSRNFHPEQTLLLTWDSGYTNICIYDHGRLVHSWERPAGFLKGVEIQDEHLGKIRIKFTDTRPLQLELKVAGKKYKPNKEGKQQHDLSGIISVFWAMTAFTGVLFLYILGNILLYKELLNDVFSAILMFLTLVIFIYVASALLVSKKHYWGYFLGTGYLFFSTLYYAWTGFTFKGSEILLLLVFIRAGLLVYLIASIRKVIFAMNHKKPEENNSIIDEKF